MSRNFLLKLLAINFCNLKNFLTYFLVPLFVLFAAIWAKKWGEKKKERKWSILIKNIKIIYAYKERKDIFKFIEDFMNSTLNILLRSVARYTKKTVMFLNSLQIKLLI